MTATPGFVRIGENRFKFPADSRWFDGHFDGAPILPGVAHLALALAASRSDRILRGVRNVRFSNPIFPDDELEVVFDDAGSASSIRFEIHRHDGIATVGVLVFEP